MRYSSRRIGILVLAGIAIVAFGALAVACGEDEADEDANGGETPVLDVTPSASFAEACRKSDEKQFSEAPPQIIDTNKTYVATIKTAKGDIKLELLPDRAPIAVNNLVFLACKGYYDGIVFHRVDPGFVIQGGDPMGTGAGGPGYTIADEINDMPFDTGVLGMAKTGAPDSGGSQFFITLGPAPHLDGGYTAFGSVTEGMDVVQKIAIGDVMETITVEES